MVELRKRSAPPPPAPPKQKKQATTKSKAKKDAPKAAEPEEAPAAAPAAAEAPAEPEAPKGGVPKVGDSITLEGFGGEVETNDGEKTTLAKLVSDSKAGVVLFTYPKASTPGCEHLSPIVGKSNRLT